MQRREAVALEPGMGFERFYETEYRPLLRLAWSLTGRRDLGEELVQDTMLSVHRRWPKVCRYEHPGAFARRVLLNNAASLARRRSSERRAVSRLDVANVVAAAEPPDDAFWDALRSLPDRQAQVLALYYVEDLGVEEIGEVLDIASGTVKSHLHRGRGAMARQLFAEEGDR